MGGQPSATKLQVALGAGKGLRDPQSHKSPGGCLLALPAAVGGVAGSVPWFVGWSRVKAALLVNDLQKPGRAGFSVVVVGLQDQPTFRRGLFFLSPFSGDHHTRIWTNPVLLFPYMRLKSACVLMRGFCG